MTDDNLPLMQRKFYKEDHAKFLADIQSINANLQILLNRYITDETVLPVMRVNLQNVTQTFGALTTSVIMDFEKMGTREEEGEAPPDAETKIT